MRHKLRLYSVLVVACMLSILSHLYVQNQLAKDNSPYNFTNLMEKPFQEKGYLPEVKFVEKIFKSIFHLAQFK